MQNETQKLKEQLKSKEKEVIELKNLLAEAEQEIKELNNFHGLKRPKPGVLESAFLNKLIKRAAFLLLCAVIVLIGIYPWLFKNKILNEAEEDKAAKEDSEANFAPEDKTLTGEDVSPREESRPDDAQPSPALSET